jgi:hypothetical protein
VCSGGRCVLAALSLTLTPAGSTPEAEGLRRRGHLFTTTPGIGAAHGIEPVRRGGGSAMVESPGS